MYIIHTNDTISDLSSLLFVSMGFIPYYVSGTMHDYKVSTYWQLSAVQL